MNPSQEFVRTELFNSIEQGILVAGGKGASLVVVLPFVIGSGTIAELLKLPGVAGLMLPDSCRESLAELAVGFIPGAGDWELPKVSANGMLLLADPTSLAIAWWRSALRAGLRRCVFMTPEGRWDVRSLRAEFVRQLLRRAVVRARNRIAGNPEHWLERCLNESWSHCRRGDGHSLRQGVTHVTASLGAGGAERQLVRLCNAQVSAGVPVFLLVSGAWQAGGDFFGGELKPEVQLGYLPSLPELMAGLNGERQAVWASRCGDGSERLLAQLPAGFAETVRRFRAEFLITRPALVHLWQDEVNVAAGLGALLAGVPRIILAQRSLAPWRFAHYSGLLRPLYRFLASQERVVMLNNTQAGALDYARWLDLPRGRIVVIANAVDTRLVFPKPTALAAWRELHGVTTSPVIGGIFRLMDVKDPLLWLATMALVAKKHPSASFLLVGDGLLHQAVLEAIGRAGLAERICWLASERNVGLPLAAMDVFLLTSRAEGMPNVLMEAGLIGCPVVAIDVGGCAEVVNNGVNGWLVNDRRPEVLAERILSVLSDQNALERMRREAPDFIRQRFSIERMLAKTLAAYAWENKGAGQASDGKVDMLECE